MNNNSTDWGKLLLRVALGVLILLHGIAKLRGGFGYVISVVEKAGLPTALAYGAYVGELLAPLLLIAGAWTRVAAALVAINMLFAVALSGGFGHFFAINQYGGWALELEGLYFVAALAIALLGAGRLSIGGANGRFN